jgi:hypothetical protein
MGLDVFCTFIHISRLFEVYVAIKIILISGVSVGECENTQKEHPGPSVYEMLEIHSLFYSCWFWDCKHWFGNVKENCCGISVLNFTLGELCTQSCVSVCVALCYCALNTINCNNWKWWNIIHTYYNMWFWDEPRAFRIWGVIVSSVTWNSTLLYQHNTLKHSLYQQKRAFYKIHFMTGIELLHVLALGCHPQGVF